MSFWKKIEQVAAPVAAIVVAVVAPELAPAIGTALLGEGAGTAATYAAGQAVISGGIGAAQAATTGQDVVKGATKGAESGLVSGAITGGLQGVDITGTGDTSANTAVTKGLATAGGAAATGTKPSTAIEEGIISGAVDYLIGSPGKDASTTDQILSGLEKYGITTTLDKSLFPSQTSGGGATGASTTISGAPTATVTPQAAGTTPGSSALAQALNVGDIGAPIFGSSDLGKSRRVWNKESLRNPNQGA
jgi:hypothetical protein